MRARAAVLAIAGLAGFALMGAACGSSKDSTDVAKPPAVRESAVAAKPSAGLGGGPLTDQQIYDGLMKYAKCMRDNGVTKFPDPVLGQGLQVNGNDVQSDTDTYRTADSACKSLVPNGGPADEAPADREAAMKYSKCMRDSGVAKFPDPGPGGGLNLDGDKLGMTPDDPIFQKAQKACEQYLGNGNTSGK